MKSVQTASHWGVYDVRLDELGALSGTSPQRLDRQPSDLNPGLPEMVRSQLRVERPFVREGYLRDRNNSRALRGRDRFVEVTWDRALSLIENELRRVKTEFGNEAIYGGSYGWASAGRLHHSPSVLKRFLGLHGGYVDKLGNHSFGAALHIAPYVIGRADIPNLAMPWPLIVEHTRLMVLFGGAHLKNTQIDAGGTVLHDAQHWFGKVRSAGIEVVNISPSQEDVCESVRSSWLGLRPNTDVALMLGLAHTLVRDKLHDQAFLARYCVGFAQFEDYLMGRADGSPKSADWAAAICGIPADVIVALARKMATTRTLISTSWSVQRADHGEQPIWMTIVLAAMLGQIGLPGGGFSFGLAAVSGVGMPHMASMPRPTLPLGPNAVKNHVPVGRVTDMLLNPGAKLDYNGKTIVFPDIRLIYSVGGNPFHHNTNLNRFLQAWQRPETIIVHEPWWGPPAKFADIVLPATTTLERNDIQASDMSRFYVAMRQVIGPVGQSRNDFDIFSELADRLGFADAYHEGRDEMGWLRRMYETARQEAARLQFPLPGFDEFWEAGLCEFPEPLSCEPLLGPFRDDPAVNALQTPSGKIEIYSEKIAGFGYHDCPAHPAWIEPAEWLGSSRSASFPLHLLSNQPATRLHSQLDPTELSRASKIAGREPLKMNRRDAAARGLETGDTVRVFNERGAFISAVKVVDSLREGVAQIATGAWYDPEHPGEPGGLEKHGNPNMVTDDKGTSQLGQSSAAQTVLVEIEPYRLPPQVTAFDLPDGIAAARSRQDIAAPAEPTAAEFR
jgi:biotin/methionine sulfoxide reductase